MSRLRRRRFLGAAGAAIASSAISVLATTPVSARSSRIVIGELKGVDGQVLTLSTTYGRRLLRIQPITIFDSLRASLSDFLPGAEVVAELGTDEATMQRLSFLYRVDEGPLDYQDSSEIVVGGRAMHLLVQTAGRNNTREHDLPIQSLRDGSRVAVRHRSAPTAIRRLAVQVTALE